MNAVIQPPRAKTVPHPFTHLGRVFDDPYSWLQDKADPQVIAYLEAENAYAQAVLAHTKPLQEQLFNEMRGYIQEDETSAPELRRGYLYYWRMHAGKQYRSFYRRPDEQGAPEQLLLDENALAEGKDYCRVAVFQPSPDQKLLAYSVDTTGSFVFDLYIRDIETGQVLVGPIPHTAYTAAWAADSRTLFYTVFDASHRPYQLYRISVDDPANPVLVYHELDDSLVLRVALSRSQAFLLLTILSHSTSEVRYLPAGEPGGEFRIIQPRQHWLEYYVEHQGDRFLIRTNEQALNFKLMSAPVDHPSKENWQELIPHRADTLLENMFAFQSHLVLSERKGGLHQLRISAPDGLTNVRYVQFPEPVYTISWVENPEYDSDLFRFQYSSLVTPETTVDYDMERGAWNVIKRQEIPSGYDPEEFVSERLHAVAPDGAQVPISIVYRKGLKRDGSNPLLLLGYGSYSFSFEPSFDAKRLSLLRRGFAIAIAHIRGGSELGREWYENGRLMHKKNTFSDFIACAEQLVAQGYTAPEHLAIMGRSAGGLLMSAVANLRPDLFKAVVAIVPFTNVITAMLMPDLPLTVIEYEQWGHPDDPQAFEYMLSYSPYENITAKGYPNIYARAGLNDLQVPYWDAAKWVAKLRALKTDSNRLLFSTYMSAGHGGYSGRYDHLHEDAEVYAFIIDTLGVDLTPL